MVKQTASVTEYQFQSFNEVEEGSDTVKLFEFKPLFNNSQITAKADFQKTIKNERIAAKTSHFKVNPIVEQFRGLKDQEEKEYEDRVEQEVKRRVQLISEDAYKIGFDEGIKQGREEIFDQMRSSVDEKLDDFSVMVSDVLNTQEEILTHQKKEMYQLLRNLSKWIVLRELDEDGKYIERLLEKLLLEMQSRHNLLILVNPTDFATMPEVLEHVQTRLGELKNVRIEMDTSVRTKGIIVESENGIINATMEEQFKSLDKLFEDVLSKT